MALKFTDTLLQAQRELGKANRPIDFGSLMKLTIGEQFKTIQKQLKAREDEYLENKKEFDNLELTEEDYAGAWNKEMIAEMSRLKNEYNQAAITVKRTRNTNSQEYIDALAKMNRIQGSLGDTRTFIEGWQADSEEFATIVEEGRVSKGLSFNQQARLHAYHSAATTKPKWVNNKIGIEYTWVDKDGNTRTEFATQGNEPKFFEPATEETMAINDKYLEAVEKIGKGTFNAKAWTQDMRNFVNTMDYNALLSIAGDFSSVNGKQSFSQHDWVMDTQEEYERLYGETEYDMWWQDPRLAPQLKEGLVQFFNDVYLPQFAEFEKVKNANSVANNLRTRLANGEDINEKFLTDAMLNAKATQALSAPIDEAAGFMYADQVYNTLQNMNMSDPETGAPMRIGFISGSAKSVQVGTDDDGKPIMLKLPITPQGPQVDAWTIEQWDQALAGGSNPYNGDDGQLGYRLQEGDYIVLYPGGAYEETSVEDRSGTRKTTKQKRVTPRIVKVGSFNDTRDGLLQQLQLAKDDLVLDLYYLTGQVPAQNPYVRETRPITLPGPNQP